MEIRMRIVCLFFLIASSASAAEKLVLVAGGEKAGFKEPFGLDFMPDGNIVLVELVGNRVAHIDQEGKVTSYAGTGQKGRADGPAEKATFNGPHNLAVAKDGTIYVADTFNSLIRKIDPKTREVTTIAGQPKPGFSGDGGPAKDAAFASTFHVAIDPKQENLYVADLGNVRIRKIDLKTGLISTVAGNGKKGVPTDGVNATEAPLSDPRACDIDSKGRLYILERNGDALRVVEDGKIRTLISGRKVMSLDGKATDYTGTGNLLRGPKLIWVDKRDDVLIADAENNTIRQYIGKEGTCPLVAGTGKKGDTTLDKDPKECGIARPHGVAESKDGTIWITDSYNHRLLKIVK